MISQELYVAQKLMSQANARIREHQIRVELRQGRPNRVRQVLGWLSLHLVALGARLVHYGLPLHDSRDGQASVRSQGATVA